MKALRVLAGALAGELRSSYKVAGHVVDSLRRWGWRVQGAPGVKMAAEDLEDYIAEDTAWDVTLAVYSDRDLPVHHPRPPRWSVGESTLTLDGERVTGTPGPAAPHSPGGSVEGAVHRASGPGELLYSVEGRVAAAPGFAGGLWYRLASEGGASGVVLEGGPRVSVYGPRMSPPAVQVGELRGGCRASIEVDAVLGEERSYPAVIAWTGEANDVGPTVLASLTEDTFGPPAEEALKAAIAFIHRLENLDRPFRVMTGSRASSTWVSSGKWLAKLTSEALVLYDSRYLEFTPPPPGETVGPFQAAIVEALRLQGEKPRVNPLCPDPDYYVLLSRGVRVSCLGVPRGAWEKVSAALAAAARTALEAAGLEDQVNSLLWLEHGEGLLARGEEAGFQHLAALVWGGEAPGDLHEAPLDGESPGPAPSASALPVEGEALVEAAEALWRGFPASQAQVIVPLQLVPALVARGYTVRSSLAVAEALTGRLEWRSLLSGLTIAGLLEV